MKRIRQILIPATLYASSLSWGALEHGVGINLIQEKQSYYLNNREIDLVTYTPQLQYQLIYQHWQLGLSGSLADSHDQGIQSDSQLRYQITSEQNSHGIYLDYNFTQAWLSLSFSDTHNQYSHQSSDNVIRSFGGNKIDSQNWNLDFGYAWLFDNGQLSLSLGTSYQESNESFQLLQTQISVPGSVYDQDNITQSGWLGNISSHYQHYYSITKNISGMLGLGLSHSQSIKGEAYLSETSHTQLAGTRLASSEDEYFIERDSDSTSIIIQSGILLEAGTINVSLDKLTRDPWSDALLELGFSLYF